MQAAYSVLFFKENYIQQRDRIGQLLGEGKKVFWFGAPEEAEELRARYADFAKAFFLQAFEITDVDGQQDYKPFTIYDGVGIDEAHADVFDWMEENIPAFNAAQYRVEHCAESEHIVVKASAGTGKTTVMIDRILYLMHMVPGLQMSDIYMITFTNEATNQMNRRLQEVLFKKYALTKNKRYLNWLEQQSQMHISTIDSLAYDLFRRFGTSVGYGRDLRIQTLAKERKDVIKDALSDALSDRSAITTQIGMNYAEACRLIDEYWKALTRKGYTVSEILSKDWGELPGEPVLANFQRILRAVLHTSEENYRQLKLEENAISINDLFFDFGHFLLEDQICCDGLDMRYLFVDEFQDTDATQIRTFAKLVKTIGARLFAVGDVKQSIYAFKGATDEAFDILEAEMKGRLHHFSLRNNYRTCANIMQVMEEYFFAWASDGLLRYDEAVRPFNTKTGTVSMEFFEKKDELPGKTLDAIDTALNDLEMEVRSGRQKVSDQTKVAVLVRGNRKAAEIAALCRAHGKTVVLSSDRPFFLSQAVRDFHALISSFIFMDQPIYSFNYLMTPYASYEGMISVAAMEEYDGDVEKVQAYLQRFMAETSWQTYQRAFRLQPVLSVIRDIVEKENVIERYITMDKLHMTGDAWTDAKRNRQALIDAKQYQMDLDKLMEMLEQRMDGEFATLYDLYSYLSLMIATNREEMEPEIEMSDDYTSVYIMTVHKSKGLEFDTVILPEMNGNLVPFESTTMLVDQEKLAWCYMRNQNQKMESAWYPELRKRADQKGVEEETRMLYVAMTRAVNHLMLIVNRWDGYESWSSLIRKVGLIDA